MNFEMRAPRPLVVLVAIWLAAAAVCGQGESNGSSAEGDVAASAVDLVVRAKQCLMMGDDDCVLFSLNRAVDLDPTLGIAYHNRGAAHFRAGRPDQALNDFTKAKEHLGGVGYVLRHRGAALIELGHTDEGLVELHAGARMENSTEAFNELGKAYQEAGRYKDAIGSFQQSLGLEPGLEAALGVAEGWVSLGDLDQGIAVYTMIMRDIGDTCKECTASALEGRMKAFVAARMYERALQDLEQLIAADPDAAPQWRCHEAKVLRLLSDYPMALAALELCKPQHGDLKEVQAAVWTAEEAVLDVLDRAVTGTAMERYLLDIARRGLLPLLLDGVLCSAIITLGAVLRLRWAIFAMIAPVAASVMYCTWM